MGQVSGRRICRRCGAWIENALSNRRQHADPRVCLKQLRDNELAYLRAENEHLHAIVTNQSRPLLVEEDNHASA